MLKKETDYLPDPDVVNYTCWFNRIEPCIELEDETGTCTKCAANYTLNYDMT